MAFRTKARKSKSLCFDIEFTEPHAPGRRKTARIWSSSEADAEARFVALWRRATILAMEPAGQKVFA